MPTMREALEVQRRAFALLEVALGRCGWMLRDSIWRAERRAEQEAAVMGTSGTALLGALEDATEAADGLRDRLEDAANAAADAGRVQMAAELDRLRDAADDIVSRVTAQRGVARYSG